MKINLEQSEKIIYTARRHWFVILGRVLGILLLFIAPVIVYIFITTYGFPMPRLISGSLVFLSAALLSIWTLVLWILLFVIWTNYFLDVLIITNRKVIDIEQRGLFSREVSSFPLERIQDITIDIDGVIPTFLNFGDVHVQTAGAGGSREFILRGAMHPASVKERILKEQQNIITKRGNVI